MGEGNKKLNKRDPESNLFHHRERGLHPRGPGQLPVAARLVADPDRDVFGARRTGRRLRRRRCEPEPGPLRPEEGRVDQRRPHPSPGQRRLHRADGPVPRATWSASRRATADPRSCARPRRWFRSGCNLLDEAPGMLSLPLYPGRRHRVRCRCAPGGADAARVLDAASAALERLETSPPRPSRSALRVALIDGAGLKPRIAFGAAAHRDLRGRRVSPPLFESMELLGKDSTLVRIARLRLHLAWLRSAAKRRVSKPLASPAASASRRCAPARRCGSVPAAAAAPPRR